MMNKEKAAKEQPDLQADPQAQGYAEDGQQEANSTDTTVEVTDNQEDTAELQEQMNELRDKYMRMYAEFENYKRRAVREKIDWMKTASQDTLSALLPVLDDFDRARKFAENKAEAGWSEGVELVYQKLYNSLRHKGLEAMDSNGQLFDPELHEAITEIPVPSEEMKGKVVDTLEKGYLLNDKIIRHAKVVVGK